MFVYIFNVRVFNFIKIEKKDMNFFLMDCGKWKIFLSMI